MGTPKGSLWFLVVCCILISFFSKYSIAADTITPTQSINDSQTLVSAGQKFELGFFSPGNSSKRYLGIWYKSIPIPTIVWVANRDRPLTNPSGFLKFSSNGELVLLNSGGSIVWYSHLLRAAKDPVAQLLDSGNLVLKDVADGNSENYLWQSFDYPSDTLLPGMKLGWNLKTGLNRFLTSWKSLDDPSVGDYSYRLDSRGLPQLILSKGSIEQFRSGPWYGKQFTSTPVLMANPVFKPIFVSDANEVYYTYEIMDFVTARFVLSQSGLVQHLSWFDQNHSWILIFTVQDGRCDNYGLCGSYSSCNINKSPNCECLKGFEPRSPHEWEVLDWHGGCVRKAPLHCGKGEEFVKFSGLKLPDSSLFLVNESMRSRDCEALCLKNCACIAYTKLDISGSGNGCVTWYGDLIDIREVTEFGQDLYVRIAVSEQDLPGDTRKQQKYVVMIVAFSVASAMILLASFSWSVIWTKRTNEGGNIVNQTVNQDRFESREDNLDLPLFELAVIEAATDNFSSANKIGEGGFGPVYKGKLPWEQEVAVKRLSETSGQGLQEFKNEVILISKLQHRNLVKLLGCCIQGKERLLIYEYMPNKSLDFFIFDETRRSLLNWKKRFDIVVGIARGLLYLHRDSILRIIHRDLKAGNILLDREMNPKISDFGMARIFGGNQTEANTKKVVGTYGYMPPEYAIDGHFSQKSDVFSFGVILLEIMSGMKNRGFSHQDHKLNLLGHAWKLFNEGKALEFMDTLLEDQFPVSEAVRCIQVGLLCVQQRPEERPTMSVVLLMLDSESVSLPQPGRPGFYAERCFSDTDSSLVGNMMSSSNEMTITLLEGR